MNYQQFITSLYYLDNMLNGGEMHNLEIKKSGVITIRNLINKSLNKAVTKTYDSYLCSTFKAFCLSKTQLIFDLHKLDSANNKMRELIMNPINGIKLKSMFVNVFPVFVYVVLWEWLCFLYICFSYYRFLAMLFIILYLFVFDIDDFIHICNQWI